MNGFRPLAVAAILAAAASVPAHAEEWISLFDGTSFAADWEVKSGFATYRVEDGAIVGKTEDGSPNTFLITKAKYANFELEFEVKVDDGLNSGVQIRSLLQMTTPKGEPAPHGGRLGGPQVEIESGPGQAGWIYGEATGLGWLSREPESKDAAVNQHTFMKNGEWNHFRVVAQGSRIQTWINGNPVADLTHEEIFKTHPEGHIGLQVHGIKKGTGPFEVRWRKLRIKKL
jgi:hypothetical protein